MLFILLNSKCKDENNIERINSKNVPMFVVYPHTAVSPTLANTSLLESEMIEILC